VTVDCILFDFDGTLAHTEPLYTRAYRETMLRFAGVDPEPDELRGFINMTASEFAARFPSTEAMVAFEQIYHELHPEAIDAFEGVPEMLGALRAAGIALAVVSLKPRRAGEIELGLCGLRDLVDADVWGDDVPRPKPAPDTALEALARLGAVPGRALVVGDSPSDIHMAEAAGIAHAGVLWGGASRDRLVAAGATWLLESPTDLLERLIQYREL